MNEKSIYCKCGKKCTEKELKKHILSCQEFLQEFKLLDSTISRILEKYLTNKNDNIFLVRFLLKQFLKMIDSKIKEFEKDNQTKVSNEIIYTSKNDKINEDNLMRSTSHENYISKIDIINKDTEKNLSKYEEKDVDKTFNNDNNKNKNNFFSFFSTPTRFFGVFTRKCKFCGNKISKGIECLEESCKEKNEISKILCKQKNKKCKHDCLGIHEDNISCLPCFKKGCSGTNYLCQLCKEKLSSSSITSPIIKLNCGHYIHYYCIKKNLNSVINHLKSKSKKINFNCIECCEKLIVYPSTSVIQNLIEEYKKLKILEMTEQRIIYEGIQVNNNVDYSNLFIFHTCIICHQPYYAGKNNNYNYDKNKEDCDCYCGRHSYIENEKDEKDEKDEKEGDNNKNCLEHPDYIEYKCRFCCNIASRYNRQTETHFCENCYFNNYQNSIIKECNKKCCPFNGDHKPNGNEFCLGCFICRYESKIISDKTNIK